MADLFSGVCGDRTRGSGHKTEPRQFRTNTRKNFFPVRVAERWDRLPREAVGSPSLEIFKARLDASLGSLLWGTALAGGLEPVSSGGPCQPLKSVIL